MSGTLRVTDRRPLVRQDHYSDFANNQPGVWLPSGTPVRTSRRCFGPLRLPRAPRSLEEYSINNPVIQGNPY